MNNAIKLDWDQKAKRLVMTAPFHLVDIPRTFPSRRFDPRSKTWKLPLVKSNVIHFHGIRGKFDFDMTPGATAIIVGFDEMMQGPVYKSAPASLILSLMKLPPMEHQWEMLDKGWNLHGFATMAEMGTGKTYVTIAKALARWKLGLIDRFAIICPATLRRTWEREFKKYMNGDLIDFRYHSSDDKGFDAWSQTKNPRLKVLAVSVEGLGISERLYDRACGFFLGKPMIVCDESSRIKNPDAKRTERAISLASNAVYAEVLNGTPIAKGIQDLWAQYQFIDPNIIGSGDYWAFKSRYVVMGGYENKQIIGYSNVDELMGLIQPYSIDIRKRDVLKSLPPKSPKSIYIEATPEQERLFNKILTGIGDGHISTKNVLERMLRLQQVIGGFEPSTDIETDETVTTPLEKNPKMTALMQFIEDNKEGSKFIIWARYVPEIRMIIEQLGAKYGPESVLTYYGATTDEDRGEAERRYGEDPAARFLVGNPAAAGLGLTLISGENDIMFYYSGTFAFIDRAQSEDRSHRIGQMNSVLVVDCVMQDSLDEAVVAAIAAKKDMETFVKDWIAKGKSVQDLLKGSIE